MKAWIRCGNRVSSKCKKKKKKSWLTKASVCALRVLSSSSSFFACCVFADRLCVSRCPSVRGRLWAERDGGLVPAPQDGGPLRGDAADGRDIDERHHHQVGIKNVKNERTNERQIVSFLFFRFSCFFGRFDLKKQNKNVVGAKCRQGFGLCCVG